MACRRVALMTLLALTACREGSEATLSREADGSLVVGVEKAGGGLACLTDASIAVAGSGPDASPVWAVGRADLKACARIFRVGRAQAGFEQRTTAPLPPGRSYCLTVGGVGFSDTRPFTLGTDGSPTWRPRGPQDGC